MVPYIDPLFSEEDELAFVVNAGLLMDFGLTRQFIMKDIGITPRVFHHWASVGLVSVRPKQNNHNHVFSFVELIWFSIVNELREFGFSLDKIKTVHDVLMEESDIRDLFRSLPEVSKGKIINDIEALQTDLSPLKNYLLDVFRNGFENTGIPEDDYKVNKLYYYVSAFIIYRSNVYLYIDNNGKVIPSIEKLMDNATVYKAMGDNSFDGDSYICISLMKFFKKIVLDKKHLDFVRDSGILNDNEQYILSLIREGKAKAITIRFEAQKATMIEVTKEKKIKAEARVSEILLGKGYQDIQIKTQDGDIVFTNVTTKKKLK